MKTMEIVFENCECLKIDGEITFDIIEDNAGYKAIDNVKITIPKSSNGIYNPFGGNHETTKFNRLLEYDDITSIDIDGISYSPNWYEENEWCDSQSNEYQHTYRAENGDLIIEISSANKQLKSDNEKIVELVTNYMEQYPTMKFGQVIHKIECKLGNSIVYEENSTVIEMLEELLMEAI